MDFLVVDDEKSIRDAACVLIEDDKHYAEPATDSAGALQRLKQDKFDAVFLDVNLGGENGLDVLPEIVKLYPTLPVVIFTAQGSVQTAVEAMRRGAVDFLEKPFTRDQFRTVVARLGRFRQMGQRIESLEREVSEVRSASGPDMRFDFATPLMNEVMDVLMRAAKTPASILILGESGTGKSVVAQAVHEASHLKDKPFVTVSCPSLSKELLQSELFGHVKGSFTGAIKDTWGKVKQAEGGTLFIDEIGELPLELQPKLLRLLQERQYERVGETTTREANVRVIAATNRDLKQWVAEGRFREDLYFRLNVITVELPPMRARRQDILSFADHYVKHFGKQVGRKVTGFDPEARERLASHTWPGNLRELRNAIERAVILGRGDLIQVSDLPTDVQNATGGSSVRSSPAEEHRAATVTISGEGNAPSPEAPAFPSVFSNGSVSVGVGDRVSLQDLEESHIREILKKSSSLGEAAQILGIDQATLYRKRKRMGIE